MSTPLKNQYELAMKRIIKSKFAEENEKAEKKRIEEEKQRLDAIPDFVDDWKRPSKDTETKEYDHAFVENRMPDSAFAKNKPVVDPNEEIEMIEPETIYYGEHPELHWYGNFNSYTGFSKMNRSFVFGLSNKGVKIKIDNQQTPVEINSHTMGELDFMASNEISDKAPKVFSAMIPLKMIHTGKKIIYTMIESTDTVHKDYIDKLNMFDEIWVPTQFNKRLLEANNARPKIFVMPLGVDIDRYNADVKPYNFNMYLNKFVFLSVFKWNFRKGWDILLKSFMEEFSSDEDVSLLMVSRTDVYHKPEIIANDFMSVRGSVSKSNDDLPHVALFDKKIHEKDMPSIYKASNAFVLISRGEGFGLPYCEAAACGLPVIGSNCSAQADYLKKDNSFLVEPDGYVQAKSNGNLSRLAKHCHFYEDQVFPDFSRGAIDQTKQHMRYVFENYKQACLKAHKLTAFVRKNYSWEKAVNNVYNRVIDLQ